MILGTKGLIFELRDLLFSHRLPGCSGLISTHGRARIDDILHAKSNCIANPPPSSAVQTNSKCWTVHGVEATTCAQFLVLAILP